MQYDSQFMNYSYYQADTQVYNRNYISFSQKELSTENKPEGSSDSMNTNHVKVESLSTKIARSRTCRYCKSEFVSRNILFHQHLLNCSLRDVKLEMNSAGTETNFRTIIEMTDETSIIEFTASELTEEILSVKV